MVDFNILVFLKTITAINIIDIFLVAFAIYTLFFWFKRTKAAFVFIGFIVCGIAYLIFRLFRLQLAASLLQGFFAVVIIALIIIFQEEIRHAFERIASRGLHCCFKRIKPAPTFFKETEIVVKTVFDLAKRKTGAIIVLTGRDMITGYVYGGIELDGILSEPLLKSIFDPHSIGHDGAVVIEEGRVMKFACRLPLSKEVEKLKNTGLRHAAALGLAELTDALCLVVSEERGAVAVARYGKIKTIEDENRLVQFLENFYQQIKPVNKSKSLRNFFMKNAKEKLLAILIALSLWFSLIYGSAIVYKSFRIPVSSVGLTKGIIVTKIDPDETTLVLSGQRKDFYFVGRDDIKVTLKLFSLGDSDELSGGFYEVPVTTSDVTLPSNLSIVNTVPRDVKVYIDKHF